MLAKTKQTESLEQLYISTNNNLGINTPSIGLFNINLFCSFPSDTTNSNEPEIATIT